METIVRCPWKNRYSLGGEIGEGAKVKIDISVEKKGSVDSAQLKKLKELKKQIEGKVEKSLKFKAAAKGLNDYINNNIDDAINGDLSEYATQIKNFALEAIELLILCKFLNHESIYYLIEEETIYIDDEEHWYLG
jgi:hypothetical protein